MTYYIPQSRKSEKNKEYVGGGRGPGKFEVSKLFLILFPASAKKDIFILEGKLPLKQCPELAQYSQAL